MTGLEAIKKKLKTDPNYSKEDAVAEWVRVNPDEAVELAQQIWPNFYSDYTSYPMDYDELEDYLSKQDPIEAFLAGYYSASNGFSLSDDYYQRDGNGHFSSMDEEQYIDACKEFMDVRGYKYVLENADYLDLPEELEEIVDWDEESKNLCPIRRNKPRAKPPVKKQPAKRQPSRKPSNAKSGAAKFSNVKSRNAKASPKRKPSQARRR